MQAAQLPAENSVREQRLGGDHGKAVRLPRKERQLHTTCEEGESFYVSSPPLSFLEGCYEATDVEEFGEIVYATGTTDAVGDTLVRAADFVLDGDIVVRTSMPTSAGRRGCPSSREGHA